MGRQSKRGSASFEMFKGMEVRDEFQKVKMAGFLRELHKLAMEESKQKARTFIERQNSGECKVTEAAGRADGSISLRGVDLMSLLPTVAQTKIDSLHSGEKLDSESLIKLAKAGVAVMSQEETVVDLRPLNPKKVTVVGDLHGSLSCLVNVLKLVNIDMKEKLEDTGRVVVFDGDFVDRGLNSLEVLSTLLLLKLAHPKNVILLRGNHEDCMTASTYGCRDEIDEKYGYEAGDEIWEVFGNLFAAFPIIARTPNAAIMHGGIPVEDFSLETVNQLSKETRCELKTVVDPYDEEERLVQGILWSDPSIEDGINLGERGAGYEFGPDIIRLFLDCHGLKYIVRAHEPFEDGFNHQDIGDGRGVITIFSTANYPNGEGTNMGAVLHLDEEKGEFAPETFEYQEEVSASRAYEGFLRAFIDDNKSKVTKAFRAEQNKKGKVTIEQWAEIMTNHLPGVEWMELQPELAPTTKADGKYIDWMAFLTKYSTRIPKTDFLEKDQLSALHKHKAKFLNIFQLMDVDGSGTISKEEFASGTKLLNDQIPDGQAKVENPEELFDAFDINGDGEIGIEEFVHALQESEALKSVTENLKGKQIESLQENHEMLLVAFKYLDTDHSGAIDKEEFERGINALNNRLPEKNQLGDPLELFELIDADGNGEIDINEFNDLFRFL